MFKYYIPAMTNTLLSLYNVAHTSYFTYIGIFDNDFVTVIPINVTYCPRWRNRVIMEMKWKWVLNEYLYDNALWKAILGRGQCGWRVYFLYGSCPRCRIDRLKFRPVVQRATTVLRLSPEYNHVKTTSTEWWFNASSRSVFKIFR